MHWNFKDLTSVKWRRRFPLPFQSRLKALWTRSNAPPVHFRCLGRPWSRSIKNPGASLHQVPLFLHLYLASGFFSGYSLCTETQALLDFTKDPTKLCSIMHSSSFVSFKSINYSHSSYPNENTPCSFEILDKNFGGKKKCSRAPSFLDYSQAS